MERDAGLTIVAIDRSYLPPLARKLKPYTPEGSDLLVWEYEAGGRPYAIVYAKDQRKPLWHLMFSSPKSRQRHIDNTVKAQSREKIVARFLTA
jgi:hypothetical protein